MWQKAVLLDICGNNDELENFGYALYSYSYFNISGRVQKYVVMWKFCL